MVNMKKLFIACSMLLLLSCNRAEKEGATAVTLNIPASFGQKAIVSQDFSTQSLNSNIVPTDLSDLNCFLALIAGPEEKMRDNVCKYKNTSTQFAVGMITNGFARSGATGAQLNFEVPNGKDRSIYLVGFKVDSTAVAAAGTSVEKVCSNFVKDEALQTYISDPYMLATATGLAMTGEDLSVSMTATYNASNQVGDCKGPDFPNGGGSTGTAPYKFAISFQDGLGTSTKFFSQNKCVGVRFQVQDSSGLRADMSANPNISGRVTMNYNGNAIGTFYHTGGSYGCAPGTEISSASSDMTLSFKNGVTAFSDFVAYFSPSEAQTSTRSITVQNNGSTSLTGEAISMKSGTASFSYVSTSTPPVKYAIYDLFSNKSTGSATTLIDRVVIKANQCRVGALQFLDAHGVPTKMTLTTGPFQNVDITPIGTTSNLKFYPTSSDCSISSNDFSVASIPMVQSSSYGSYNFNYKMAIAYTGFSFSALNASGTSTPAISTGNMSGSSNFWGAE